MSGSPKSRKEQKLEKKINDFLGAACKEFSRKGFYGASLDGITSRLLLSPKSIYNYFESKTDLYLSCLHFTLDQTTNILTEQKKIHKNHLDMLVQIVMQVFAEIPHAKIIINTPEDFTLNADNYLSENEQDKLKDYLAKREKLWSDLEVLFQTGKNKGEIYYDDTLNINLLVATLFSFFIDLDRLNKPKVTDQDYSIFVEKTLLRVFAP